IQFTTALILGVNGIKSGCDFPLWMQYLLVFYMITFIVLFGNFYAKAYIHKEKEAKKSKDEIQNNNNCPEVTNENDKKSQ
ncbi:elongation of very long chain fatty acids protein 5-like, partial [Diaphorina citri]